jgi:hypothetical protein
MTTTLLQPTDEQLDEIFRQSAGYGRDDYRSFARAVLEAAQPAPVPTVNPCGAHAVGGPCVLPAGHNMGRADVPANHQSAATVPEDSGCLACVTCGAPAAPVPVPLTQDQVVDAFCKLPHKVQYVAIFQAGVDFAERRHGIAASPEKKP